MLFGESDVLIGYNRWFVMFCEATLGIFYFPNKLDLWFPLLINVQYYANKSLTANIGTCFMVCKDTGPRFSEQMKLLNDKNIETYLNATRRLNMQDTYNRTSYIPSEI
jgi:hypothetical protein